MTGWIVVRKEKDKSHPDITLTKPQASSGVFGPQLDVYLDQDYAKIVADGLGFEVAKVEVTLI